MRTTTSADSMLAGIDVAKALADALKGARVPKPATLLKREPRERATGNASGGTRSRVTEIPCSGIRDETASSGKREVTVTLLGATILLDGARVVPVPGDAVTIRGETFEIIAVEDDPVAAAYVCTCSAAGPGVR